MKTPVLRRPAAWLLTLVFVWGSAGTPVLDGWLHATRGASPLPPHECAWCRVVTTPSAPGPGEPELAPVAALSPIAGPRPGRMAAPGAPSCRTPPARGPPAA